MDICALIMAGGKGTRFWPLSTEEKPKQFLNLIGNETMIQMTVNRILPIIPMEKIFVSTGEKYLDLVKEQLPNLPDRNIIVEPEGRNTAPCIALSAMVINRYFENSSMVVLPSDHLIKDEDKFREIIIEGSKFLEKNEGIVTLGMKPDRPETGYGYIKFGENINQNIKKVDMFVEKPNLETAKRYLNEGNYLWNGGMFLWKSDYIIKEIKKHIPDTYEALHNIENIEESSLQEYINGNYYKTDSISIDYAVLEKSYNIYVILSEIGWDDVGSWEALERYKEKDENGNIIIGNIKAIDGKNNLLISSNNTVVISGLDNLYVIENDGKILIGKKNDLKNIKNLKEAIE